MAGARFIPQEEHYVDGADKVFNVPAGTNSTRYDGVHWTAGFYDVKGGALLEICGAPFIRPRVSKGPSNYESLQCLSSTLRSLAEGIQNGTSLAGLRPEVLKEYTLLTHLAEVAEDLAQKADGAPTGGSK